MKVYILCAHIETKADLHRILKTTLCFPEHYGSNLDGLFDCLTDLRKPVTLVLCDFSYLQERLGDYAAKLVKVLENASAENSQFSFAFEMADVLVLEN
ncbi:MAG: barstar family protein [Oscillospiraceae bacterium]|nr:barstar family protein [Oscillospiraceae bacterium]